MIIFGVPPKNLTIANIKIRNLECVNVILNCGIDGAQYSMNVARVQEKSCMKILMTRERNTNH